MTVDESIEVLIRHELHWEHLLEQGICDPHEGRETISALTLAIASLEALEEIRQEAVDAIEDGLYVRNSRILDIIDKHIKEVEE